MATKMGNETEARHAQLCPVISLDSGTISVFPVSGRSNDIVGWLGRVTLNRTDVGVIPAEFGKL